MAGFFIMGEFLGQTYIPRPEKVWQEACGLVAVYTNNPKRQFETAFMMGIGVHHRGQHGVGIVTDSMKIPFTSDQLLPETFTKKVVAENEQGFANPATWTMLHFRYGTDGDYGQNNLQPCTALTGNGDRVAVVHNGQFTAVDKMRSMLKQEVSEGASDTLIFTQLLAEAEGISWEDKIINLLSKVNGAYSLVIGIKNALYLARDTFGLRPLVIGKIDDGFVVASETQGLNKSGIQTIAGVKRGEILRINHDGPSIIQEGLNGPGNVCDFEWDYFSHPLSHSPIYLQPDDVEHPERWMSNLAFRQRCGEILAEESPVSNASFVVGIPDSGTAVATGYASRSGKPLRPYVIRDHYYPNGRGRTFLRD